MKIRRTASALLIAVCCLLLTACPPDGGDLAPLPQDGATISSTTIKDDTLRVEHHGVAITARGVWSVSDSYTTITTEVSNESENVVVINFDECELMNESSQQKLKLRAVAEYGAGGSWNYIAERVVTINAHQRRKFDLGFLIESQDGRTSVSRDVRGQKIRLLIPVQINAAVPDRSDFIFAFIYGEHRQ
ncbi:MAG: hypothetical protein WBP93_04305 [Pyrinomonadaceae bacterium]